MNPANIYAIMSDNAYSVQVRFLTDSSSTSGKVYDYVTNIPGIKVGDFVIVNAPDFSRSDDQDIKIPKTCMIVSVDDSVTFDPMTTKAYGWLVSKVDYTYYNKLQEVIQHEAEQLRKAQRAKMREQFRATVTNMMLESAPKDVL